MPSPLSIDLRKRAIEAYERGEGTQVEIAGRFGVGEATIRRWWRLKRESGGLEPNTDFRYGPEPLLNEEALEVLHDILVEKPDAILEELAEELAKRTGITVSISTFSRTCIKLGWSQKKGSSGSRCVSASKPPMPRRA